VVVVVGGTGLVGIRPTLERREGVVPEEPGEPVPEPGGGGAEGVCKIFNEAKACGTLLV
tara:strand:- start:33 stop:209 length:177 start_codon:yes stop_codon:yes gene_type:complete